ncbi:hypothetical protein B0H17DRAFT_1217513 [Mycena rosella]|uniref:Extracellular membrane protein CFEM domain-containing protein n=1 Tax=Mycena rosella TaxID=1033263 RepID=A0AAD7BY30_MYCRO|nr:hypothetical protein B0H17DRAFT_1217513 [Mycena rosella]
MLLFALLLVSLITVHSATTQTAPQYDPPALGTASYANAQFAAGTCSGLVGDCVCVGTLDSPPLGNLTTCLQGPTCSMSAVDTQTYISGLLACEGCTSTSSSLHTEINSGSTSAGEILGTTVTGGLPSLSGGTPPPQSSSKKIGGTARSRRFLTFGATSTGVLFGTMLFGTMFV